MGDAKGSVTQVEVSKVASSFALKGQLQFAGTEYEYKRKSGKIACRSSVGDASNRTEARIFFQMLECSK